MAHDVALIYADDGQQWVHFIQNMLEGLDAEIQPKIYCASLDELNPPLHPKQVSSISVTKVQVMLLSPQTLQFLDGISSSDFDCLFHNPNQAIAVYLGIDEEDFTDSHAEKLPRFSHWTKVLELGETACDVKKNLLAKVIEKIDDAEDDAEDNYEDVPDNPAGVVSDASYMDMDVQGGHLRPAEEMTETKDQDEQNDQENLYLEMGTSTQSCDQDSTYLIMGDPTITPKPSANRNKEPQRIRKRSFDKKPKRKKSETGKAQFRIYPKQLNLQNKDDIIATFHSEPSNPKFYIQYSDSREEISKKKINVLTYKILIPDDTQSGSINFAIYDESKCLGNQEVEYLTQLDQLTSLLEMTISPLTLLSSALGLDSANTEAVDQALSDMFQKGMPDQCMKGLFQAYLQQQDEKSTKELPTLIHFTAKYGLKELCNLLLSCPGAKEAFSIENCDGDFPNAIADKAGHGELAEFMEEFFSTEDVVDNIYMTMYGGRHIYDDMGYTKGNSGYDSPFPVAIPSGSPEVYSDVPDSSSHLLPGYISMTGTSSSTPCKPPSSAPPKLSTTSPPTGEPPPLPPARGKGRPTDIPVNAHDNEPNSDPDTPDEVQEVVGERTRSQSLSYLYSMNLGKKQTKFDKFKAKFGRGSSLKAPFSEVEYEYAATTFGSAGSAATLPIMSKLSAEPSGGIMAVQHRRVPLSVVCPESNSLQQLKDIQEEFKRGELNIADVSLLFEDWNRRYAKPPKSFKERKEMLLEFRDQNQKAMEKCEKTKKSRFKVFARKKSKSGLSTIGKLASAASLDIPYIAKPEPVQKLKQNLQQQDRGSTLSNSSTSSDDSRCSTRDSGSYSSEEVHTTDSNITPRLGHSLADKSGLPESIGDQMAPIEEEHCSRDSGNRQSADKLKKLMETDYSLPLPPRPPKPEARSPKPPQIPKKPAPPPKDFQQPSSPPVSRPPPPSPLHKSAPPSPPNPSSPLSPKRAPSPPAKFSSPVLPKRAPSPPAKPQIKARTSPAGNDADEQTTGPLRPPVARKPRAGGFDDVLKQMQFKNFVKDVREEKTEQTAESSAPELVEEEEDDDVPSMPPPPPPSRPPKPKRF